MNKLITPLPTWTGPIPMLGILQAVKGAFWPPQRNEESQEHDNASSTRESTNLTGRVTQYDKATGSGMINHSVFFSREVIVGSGRPQVELNKGWGGRRVVLGG